MRKGRSRKQAVCPGATGFPPAVNESQSTVAVRKVCAVKNTITTDGELFHVHQIDYGIVIGSGSARNGNGQCQRKQSGLLRIEAGLLQSEKYLL